VPAKPRYTHLTRALTDRRSPREKIRYPIAPARLDEDTFIARLSWKAHPKVKDDGRFLVKSLKDRPDVALFLDSSFVTRDTDDRAVTLFGFTIKSQVSRIGQYVDRPASVLGSVGALVLRRGEARY
jgi:hypothetical protein